MLGVTIFSLYNTYLVNITVNLQFWISGDRQLVNIVQSAGADTEPVFSKICWKSEKSCISKLLHLCNPIFFFGQIDPFFRLANVCFSRKFLKKVAKFLRLRFNTSTLNIFTKGETFRKFTEWKIYKKENALSELKDYIIVTCVYTRLLTFNF